MSIANQLVDFIAASLADADAAFVDDFVQNGPIPGGAEGAYRYLLAVALRKKTAPELAAETGVSEAVAGRLLEWLEKGTKE